MTEVGHQHHDNMEAVSRDRAMQMCPYLARLSIEDAEAMMDLMALTQEMANVPVVVTEPTTSEKPLVTVRAEAQVVHESLLVSSSEALEISVNRPPLEQIEAVFVEEIEAIVQQNAQEVTPQITIDIAPEMPKITEETPLNIETAASPIFPVATTEAVIVEDKIVPASHEIVEAAATTTVVEETIVEVSQEAASPIEQFDPVFTIDRELLATVHPELSEDLEGLVEHTAEQPTMPEVPLLPQLVIESKEQFVETAEPEEAVIVETLNILIESAAARLEVLSTADGTDGVEAEQIQLMIIEWYDELLTMVSPDYDQAEVRKFITAIVPELTPIVEKALQKIEDQGTHEKKHDLIASLAQALNDDLATVVKRWKLGRFMFAFENA